MYGKILNTPLSFTYHNLGICDVAFLLELEQSRCPRQTGQEMADFVTSGFTPKEVELGVNSHIFKN